MGKRRREWSEPGAPGLDDWDTWLASCGRSPATRRNYTGTVRRAHAAGALDSRHALAQWLANPQWAQNTRSDYAKGLAQYLKWARRRGYRVPHPRHAGPVSPAPALPKPLTEAEVVALMTTAAPARTHDWVRLSMATGLRAGEIARLRAEDVDLVAGTVHVRGKGGRSRVVPLHGDAVLILALRPEKGPLWPGVTPSTVSVAAGRLFRAAGVPGRIHRCRHWHATALLEAGVDLVTIQQQLGHASVATTQVYLKVRPERQRDAVARLTIPAVLAA